MLVTVCLTLCCCMCVLQVVRLLGSGGFGEVYLARWHSTEVAVKSLNQSLLIPDGGMGSVSQVGSLIELKAVLTHSG